MSEEQQRRDLERRASVASVQEVAGKEGFRTFLIDCSRKQSNSYKASLRGKPPPPTTRSSWYNKANGFTIKRGDQVSIEAVAINSNGAAANTVELNPNNIQGKKYCGTKVILSIGFALGNTGRYNITLPMKPPSCVCNQNSVAALDWASGVLPNPNDNVIGGATKSITATAQLELLAKDGILPVANNYNVADAVCFPPNMSNFFKDSFCMASSASWGWTGYSRMFYNNDAGYSLFRNCFYQGVAGKQKMNVGGTFNQANPAFINGNSLTAVLTVPSAVAPPTNPINTAAIAANKNGQMWSGRNPANGNDGLQYILMRNDYQPLMGRPPNSGTYGATDAGVQQVAQGDPVVEYGVNPNTGRNEPPRPKPLTAFVVVDLEDVEFIDVNLLATRFTEALHQTNNSYRWSFQGDEENVGNPSGEDERPSFATPYGNKFGCETVQPVATSNPLELAEIWDGIFPTFTGSTYKSIPANMWIGSNMEVSSPDKLTYRENYATDWLWAGSGIGNSYAAAAAADNQFFTPDLSNPSASTENQNVGRTAQPYLWNNLIYGNMAVRDFDRWELMYHFFHGDINNLNNTTTLAGNKTADLNVRRCVILNTKIRSLIISIDNGTQTTPNGDPAPLDFGRQGGSIGHNVEGVSPQTNAPVPAMATGDNVPNTSATTNSKNYHEVSCIGSTHDEPDWVEANWGQEYTGNLLYTNMEYTEYNVKRFSELFPKGEIYEGELFGVQNQRDNDAINFNYLLDIGVADDFQSSCINTNPIRGTAAAPEVPPSPFQDGGMPSNSFDANSRSVPITPYMGGSASHPNDDTGWFRGLEGTPNVFPAATGGAWDNTVLPIQDSRFQVGTALDHMLQSSPAPNQYPYLDRFNTCPHMTFTGAGGDKERAGQGREMGRIKVNTRYYNDWRKSVVWRKDEYNLTTRLPRVGSCDAAPETLDFLDDSLSKQYGVMCIPYRYWKQDTTSTTGVSVAFVGIAFRVAERYFPQGVGSLGTPVERGTALKPYNINADNLKTLKLGRIEYGNFLGISNSFMDNPAILPMNSDDQRKTFFGGRTAIGFTPMPQDVPQNYQNYINIGASNATCSFNSDKARFEFTYFYTPTTLSAAYISANDIGSAGVPQGGTEIATVNQESGTKFFQSQIGENTNGAVNRPKDCIGLNDAFAGIYIDEVYLVPADTEIPDVAVLNNYIQRDNLYATEANFQNIVKDWIKADEYENWEGCLLDRMGFEYYDIFPPYGNNSNRFNEYSFASTEPKICNQSKKPALLNSKATVSNSLFMDVYWNSQEDPTAAGADADLYGLPLYGLGANGFIGVNQIAESAALQATQLPTLFDTAYYLIATSGLVEPQGWYGLNGVLQKTIFYCLKNYASSDMFYGYASTYSLTAEIDHPVGTVLTEIRRPDTGALVPLGENSSVIYKIQRKFEIPPIITNAEGDPIGEESQQPEPKETQLLEKIVSLLSLQVGEKSGYSEIIPQGIGAGGGGRQEGRTARMTDDPIVEQITARMGGGGVAAGLAARQNVNFGQEAIDGTVMRQPAMAREHPEGVFPEGMEMFQYPMEGQNRMGAIRGRDLPALPEVEPPFLPQAFADTALTQNEQFEIEMERLTIAQAKADDEQAESEGFIRDLQGNWVEAREGEIPVIPPFTDTARRMRLLQTDRADPFTGDLAQQLQRVGDPRDGAEIMTWRRGEGGIERMNPPPEGGGEGGVLDPVQTTQLEMDIMKHIVKTRLATLLTRGDRQPNTGAISKAILNALSGSMEGVKRAAEIISSQPDAQFYDELYGILTQITPQYPAFFSATTGRRLMSSTSPSSLEVGGDAIAVSDEALEEIVIRALETAGSIENPEEARDLNWGFPRAGDNPEMRGFLQQLEPTIDALSQRDQMRSVERPEGWSGAFSENPDVLWALGDPRIPFGSSSSNIEEAQRALGSTPEGREFQARYAEGVGEEMGRGERGERARARQAREDIMSEFRQTTPFGRRTDTPERGEEQRREQLEEARRSGDRRPVQSRAEDAGRRYEPPTEEEKKE